MKGTESKKQSDVISTEKAEELLTIASNTEQIA